MRSSTELERSVGTYLFGRRIYEVMQVWETLDTSDQPAVMREFAKVWQAVDKVVYSRTLQTAPTAKTRIERDFDPEAVRAMKAAAASDISVGGPELAAQVFKAGLVDECTCSSYRSSWEAASSRFRTMCV